MSDRDPDAAGARAEINRDLAGENDRIFSGIISEDRKQSVTELAWPVEKKEKRREMMGANSKSQNLQDNYLNQLRKDKVGVIVYLTNGVRLKGVVRGFDNFVILLQESTQQLIYKHAVSTIIPEKDIDIRREAKDI